MFMLTITHPNEVQGPPLSLWLPYFWWVPPLRYTWLNLWGPEMMKEISRVLRGEGRVKKCQCCAGNVDSVSWVEDSGLWKRIIENKPRRIGRDLILENLKFQPENFGLLSVVSGMFWSGE